MSYWYTTSVGAPVGWPSYFNSLPSNWEVQNGMSFSRNAAANAERAANGFVSGSSSGPAQPAPAAKDPITGMATQRVETAPEAPWISPAANAFDLTKSIGTPDVLLLNGSVRTFNITGFEPGVDQIYFASERRVELVGQRVIKRKGKRKGKRITKDITRVAEDALPWQLSYDGGYGQQAATLSIGGVDRGTISFAPSFEDGWSAAASQFQLILF